LKIPKELSEAIIERTDNAMTNRKRANNGLQNTTQITKDRVTRTPLKTRSELKCSGKERSSCSTCGTCHVKPNDK
jgi:hypothetical protein